MNLIPPKFTNWLKANMLSVFFGIVFVLAGSAFIYFWQGNNLLDTAKQKTTLELSALEEISQKNLELSAKVIELERELARLQSKDIAGAKTAKKLEQNNSPSNGLININLANAQELDQLPGIGQAKAQAIIDYRKLIGTYSSKDQLLDVKGIGQSLFAQIENLVSL